MAGLFENVDLSASDISVALVLAAASQQLRRKMRIKRALDPKFQALSEAGSVKGDPDDVESVATESDTEDLRSDMAGTPPACAGRGPVQRAGMPADGAQRSLVEELPVLCAGGSRAGRVQLGHRRRQQPCLRQDGVPRTGTGLTRAWHRLV